MSDIVPVIRKSKELCITAIADLSEVGHLLRSQVENSTILIDETTFSLLKETYQYAYLSATEHQTILSKLSELLEKMKPLPQILPENKSVPYLVRVK